MKRVEAASGVHYSAQKEAPRKFEPIAPVGTNYVPVGRPDIAAMRKGPASGPPPAPPAAKPAIPSAPRPVPTAPSPAPGLGKAPIASKAPTGAWPDESDSFAPPPPPPAASRPTPSVAKPAASVSAASVHPWFRWLTQCSPRLALPQQLPRPQPHPSCPRNQPRMTRLGPSVPLTPLSSFNLRNL